MAEQPGSGDLREEDDDERVEIEDYDLERDDEYSTAFFERPWFRRAAIGFAALIVFSLLLPFADIFRGGGGSDDSNATVSGPQVPLFELPSAAGGTVSLRDVAAEHDAVVIVFYRGFF